MMLSKYSVTVVGLLAVSTQWQITSSDALDGPKSTLLLRRTHEDNAINIIRTNDRKLQEQQHVVSLMDFVESHMGQDRKLATNASSALSTVSCNKKCSSTTSAIEYLSNEGVQGNSVVDCIVNIFETLIELIILALGVKLIIPVVLILNCAEGIEFCLTNLVLLLASYPAFYLILLPVSIIYAIFTCGALPGFAIGLFPDAIADMNALLDGDNLDRRLSKTDNYRRLAMTSTSSENDILRQTMMKFDGDDDLQAFVKLELKRSLSLVIESFQDIVRSGTETGTYHCRHSVCSKETFTHMVIRCLHSEIIFLITIK
jgi:hypothetical protein